MTHVTHRWHRGQTAQDSSLQLMPVAQRESLSDEPSENDNLGKVSDDEDESVPLPSHGRDTPRPSYWETLFRLLSFSFIYTKFIRRPIHDYPKVAISRKRNIAIPRLLLHLAPASASIILLWLNIRGYYIGSEMTGLTGQDTAKVNALQFTAKLHEVTMLSSLTMIVVSVIQNRVVSSGVPFGTFLAGLQFQSLSYFWSKEFSGLFKAEWGRRQGKMFLATLFLAMCLAPTIGPSSALLMIPRVDDWEVGGTDFWINATKDELWPTSVTEAGIDPSCLVDTGNLSCPYQGWRAYSGGYASYWRELPRPDVFFEAGDTPRNLVVLGRYGCRDMLMQIRGYLATTLSTSPTTVIADALTLNAWYWNRASRNPNLPIWGTFYHRNVADWKVEDVQQPVTNVACANQNLTEENSEIQLKFPVIETFGKESMDGNPFALKDYNDSQLVDQVTGLLNSSHPSLHWVDFENSKNLGNNSIGVLAVFPRSTHRNTTNVLKCTIDSRWLPLNYLTEFETSVRETWTVRTDYDPLKLAQVEHFSLPRIGLSPKWAQYLNPRLSGSNDTVLEELAQIAGVWNTTIGPSEFGPNNHPLASPVESILAAMVTNGLSNTMVSARTQGSLKSSDPRVNDNWQKHLLPQGGNTFGKGGMAWDMTGIDTANMTKFTMDATINGYAYGLEGTTTMVATVILILYCLMVFLHIIYTLKTGLVSSCWESSSEIVALAIQSRPTTTFKNTGAGISTSKLFSTNVNVSNFDQHLELTFPDTHHGSIPVKENEAYG